VVSVLRSKLLDDECCLNPRVLRIRHLDAFHIKEDLVCVFQMEVDTNDCLLDIGGEKTLIVVKGLSAGRAFHKTLKSGDQPSFDVPGDCVEGE
jgi:hypothetical protein